MLFVIIYVDDIIVGGDYNIYKKVAKEVKQNLKCLWFVNCHSFLVFKWFKKKRIFLFLRPSMSKKCWKGLVWRILNQLQLPVATSCHLSKDNGFSRVDQKLCRSMIWGLVYLTTSRPCIMHVLCLGVKF